MSIKQQTVFNVKKTVVFFFLTISMVTDQALSPSTEQGLERSHTTSQNTFLDDIDGEAFIRFSREGKKEKAAVIEVSWMKNTVYNASFLSLSYLWWKPFYYIFLFKYTPF